MTAMLGGMGIGAVVAILLIFLSRNEDIDYAAEIQKSY